MLVNNKKFTIGADPEVFVADSLTNTFVSAHDLVPGTKLEPFAVNKGAVQVDGMALEFNSRCCVTDAYSGWACTCWGVLYR